MGIIAVMWTLPRERNGIKQNQSPTQLIAPLRLIQPNKKLEARSSAQTAPGLALPEYRSRRHGLLGQSPWPTDQLWCKCLSAESKELKRWTRTVVAVGVLFATMPMASRILIGVWGFHEAAAISIICFVAGIYLYARNLGRRLWIPDGATMLDRARRLGAAGKVPKAISVLTQTIRLDPLLWQAYEYRGYLRLAQSEYGEALKDFSEAIRMAPREQHLYVLRAQTYSALGQPILATQDYQMASSLHNN
jgi:tetratricopeptide (TPR) repeat protein